MTRICAAAFGSPAIPVAIYLLQRGVLPEFMDLFQMYGGRWSSRLSDVALVVLMCAFFLATPIAAWSAWLVRQGSKAGAVMNVALLPVEAVFWIGFAMPIPWIIGGARVILIAMAWGSFGDSRVRGSDTS